MASFNGHLWMMQYWIYRLQVSWFGLDSHAFVCIVFICSLVVLHLSIAAVLRAASVSSATSLLSGGLLVYMGTASQNFIFAVQLSPTLALAAGVTATALVIGGKPTPVRAAVVAMLLIASVGIDSGVALTSVALGVTALVWTWRRWYRLAGLPSLAALGWWYLVGDLGPKFPTSKATTAEFSLHLLLRSAGGVVGLGEIAGLVVVCVAGLLIGIGISKHVITGASAALLCAGAVATSVVTVGIAQARAGLPGFNFLDFNRYLQNIDVPLFIGVIPAVNLGVRALLSGVGRLTVFPSWSRWAPPIGIGLAFVMGLGPCRDYSQQFHHWNVEVRQRVRSAVEIVLDGCPSGAAPSAAALPAGDLSPQVTVGLLTELLGRGAMHRLTPEASAGAYAGVVETVCPGS